MLPKLNAPVLVVLPNTFVAGAAPKGLVVGAAPNGEGLGAAAPDTAPNEKPPDGGARGADPEGAPAAGVAEVVEPKENAEVGAVLAAVAGAAAGVKLNIGLAASAGLSAELVLVAVLLGVPKIDAPAAGVVPKAFFVAPKGFEAPALLVAPNTLPPVLLPFAVPNADMAPPAGLPNALVAAPVPPNGLGLLEDVLPPNELGLALAVVPPNGLEAVANGLEVVVLVPKLKAGFAGASLAGSTAAAEVVEAPLVPNAEGILVLVVLKLNLGAGVVSLAGSVEEAVDEGLPNGEGAELLVLVVLKLNLGAVGFTPG